MKNIGVVGCGAMGSGIAQVCAAAGYNVVVSEISDPLLQKGLAGIDRNLSRDVERGRLTKEAKEAIHGRIKGTTSNKDFASCELVIEAAVEILDLKKKIFAELDGIVPKDSILATNTSCLSVVDIAKATNRLDKVLGLHFFNPPQAMKLLEIVRTVATSDATLQIAQDFGKSLGKTTVVAPDAPGFIVNRLWLPYVLDAVRMLESGTATKEDIDSAIVNGLNYPMGPLTLADFTGLDVLVFVADAIYAELKDPRFIAPTLVRKMVAAGWLGRKTGRGFYVYNK
ncbi:MAG: 3-hydroxybutyryl-CoA dehydrogenase [Chloroflexi bacterium]|nr:3-hydroxybutyryl-CoA dehydrogenase [Chloroflexota bacterium]